MFNNRNRNIIINKVSRNNRSTCPKPDENLMKLAEYYTRVFADSLESRHMTREQKTEALSAVYMEYNELISARRSMYMVS